MYIVNFIVNVILDLLKNPVLVSGFFAVIIAQFIKLLIDKKKHLDTNAKHFFHTGGMPSSHMCGTSAVFVSIGLINGFDSPLFAICFMICAVVMTDAKGVRYQAGKHAEYLNSFKEKENDDDLFYTSLGHTKKQVLVGMGVGALVGLIITFIYHFAEFSSYRIKYF